MDMRETLKASDGKEFWKSKTFWTSVATVVLPLFPPVAAFREMAPMVYDGILAAIFGGALRSATKDPIIWKIKKDF